MTETSDVAFCIEACGEKWRGRFLKAFIQACFIYPLGIDTSFRYLNHGDFNVYTYSYALCI